MKRNINKEEYNENYICRFLTKRNLKSAKTYKCRRVVLTRTSVYFAISNLTLPFSYLIHVPCTILTNVHFYIVRSMFVFIFNRSQSKTGAVNQMSRLTWKIPVMDFTFWQSCKLKTSIFTTNLLLYKCF